MRFTKVAVMVAMISGVMGSGLAGAVEPYGRVIMKHGDVAITQEALRMHVLMSVPKDKQDAFWADRKKVEEFVFGMFVTRKLAEAIGDRPLTPDEKLALEDVTSRMRSQFQINYLYETAPKPDFEKLALETYKVRQDEFMRPEQVRAEHILITTKDRTDEEVLALAEKLLAEIKSGEKSLADLAVEVSEDPSAKKNKGDLGYFGRNRMVKEFEEAAFGLEKAGDLAGPVKTRFGYHLIRLTDRRAAGPVPFDDVKERLIQDEMNRFRRDLVDVEIEKYKNLPDVTFDKQAFEEMVVNPFARKE